MASCGCCSQPCEDCLCSSSNSFYPNRNFTINYNFNRSIDSSNIIVEEKTRQKISYLNSIANFKNSSLSTDRRIYFAVYSDCLLEIDTIESTERFNICFSAYRGQKSKLTDINDNKIQYPDYDSQVKIFPIHAEFDYMGSLTAIYINEDSYIDNISYKLSKYELELSSDRTKWYKINEGVGIDYGSHPSSLTGIYGVCVVYSPIDNDSELTEEIAIGGLCNRLLCICEDCDYSSDNLDNLLYEPIFAADTNNGYDYNIGQPTNNPLINIVKTEDIVGDFSRLTFDLSNPDLLGTLNSAGYYEYVSWHYFFFSDRHDPINDGPLDGLSFCVQARYLGNSLLRANGTDSIRLTPAAYQENPSFPDIVPRKTLLNLGDTVGIGGIFNKPGTWKNYVEKFNNNSTSTSLISSLDMIFGEPLRFGFVVVITHTSEKNTEEDPTIVLDIANTCIKKQSMEFNNDIICNSTNIPALSNSRVVYQTVEMSDAELDFVKIGPLSLSATSQEVITAQGNSVRLIHNITNPQLLVGKNAFLVHFIKNYKASFDYNLCRWNLNIYFVCPVLYTPLSNNPLFGLVRTFFRQNGNIYIGGINGGTRLDFATRIGVDGTIFPNDGLDLSYGGSDIEIGFGYGRICDINQCLDMPTTLAIDTIALYESNTHTIKCSDTCSFVPTACQNPHCYGISHYILTITDHLYYFDSFGGGNNSQQPVLDGWWPAKGSSIVLSPGVNNFGTYSITPLFTNIQKRVPDTGLLKNTIVCTCLLQPIGSVPRSEVQSIELFVDFGMIPPFGQTQFWHVPQSLDYCEEETMLGSVARVCNVVSCQEIVQKSQSLGNNNFSALPLAKMQPFFIPT